jgi:hypothetical protein
LPKQFAQHLLQLADSKTPSVVLPTVNELLFVLKFGPKLKDCEFLMYKMLIDFYCFTSSGKSISAIKLKHYFFSKVVNDKILGCIWIQLNEMLQDQMKSWQSSNTVMRQSNLFRDIFLQKQFRGKDVVIRDLKSQILKKRNSTDY